MPGILHVLTPGFTTPNSQGFLLPILYHRQALEDAGFKIRIYRRLPEGASDCDVLMIDSKFYGPWLREKPELVLEQIAGLRRGKGRIFWFDTTDSTGTLQTDVLPHVDRYFKGQLLKDRFLYQQALYGGRLFTHYLHHELGIRDDKPTYSKPVLSKDDLSKLALSWNYGLANLSLWGPLLACCYRWLGWPLFLRLPGLWHEPSADRPRDVHSRFSVTYPKATIRYQRLAVQKLFKENRRVNRYSYYSELRSSKIVLSPFGWGEINLKDLEAIICGCLIIKPDMSHLETWPNLFEPGVTILTHGWSCQDVPEVVGNALSSYREHAAVAHAAQERYKLSFREDVFVEKFLGLFEEVRTSRTQEAVVYGKR